MCRRRASVTGRSFCLSNQTVGAKQDFCLLRISHGRGIEWCELTFGLCLAMGSAPASGATNGALAVRTRAYGSHGSDARTPFVRREGATNGSRWRLPSPSLTNAVCSHVTAGIVLAVSCHDPSPVLICPCDCSDRLRLWQLAKRPQSPAKGGSGCSHRARTRGNE